MKLLFVEGGSRVIRDKEGNIYLSSNLHRSILERYNRYCNDLTLLLRLDEKIEAQAQSDKLDENLAHVVGVPDIYRPRKNFFNPSIRRKIRDAIVQEVQKADKVIIRTVGNYYSDTAIKMCRKYHKLYMIESVEFIFEMKWYHSLLGKLAAPIAELKGRKAIAQAPYTIYVTKNALQKRYPSNGHTLGCSDVYVSDFTHNYVVTFGTAAFMNTGVKGQDYVIRALALLKSEGITNVEYHLAGGGSPDSLMKLASALNVRDQVKFFGALPHEEIFDWYDHLDVYIQPSFQEGLCRSIVEAMSRSLPVTCSRLGGNPELVNEAMMFKAGNVRKIADVMKKLLDPKVRQRESIRSFETAQDF